jgi:TupA-like ATPgrasp
MCGRFARICSALKIDRVTATSRKMIRNARDALDDRFVLLFPKYSARLRHLLPENRLGDRVYAFLLFYASHRRCPNNSMTFNDVLYRIKTTDEILDPLRIFVTDKEFAKLYIRAVVGDEYNVPTLAVLRSIDELRAYSFPPQCCIKATHGSGRVILRKDGAPIDHKKLERWFRENFYRYTREANYRWLRPKIIVEPIIFPDETLVEYKIFCFRGEPRLVRIWKDFLGNARKYLYDIDWHRMPFGLRHENDPEPLSRPLNLPEMLNIAKKLSAPFDFIRIDLYSNIERIYVGELTNCHASAMAPINPKDAESIASEFIFNNGPLPAVSANGHIEKSCMDDANHQSTRNSKVRPS